MKLQPAVCRCTDRRCPDRRCRGCRRLAPPAQAFAFACAFAFVFAAAPAPAPAQTMPNLVPPPDTLTQAQTDATPAPYLVWHPSISFTNLGYDSNVFNLPTASGERQGDWVASLASSIAPVWRPGDVIVSGSAGLVANYFQHFTTERGLDGNLAGRLDVPVSRVRLHVAGGVANLRQRVNFEIDQRARRTEDNAAAGADLLLGARTTLGLEVRRSAVTFDQGDLTTEIPLRSPIQPLRETLNREERSAIASVSYAITPITALVVTGDTGTHHFDLSPGRDGRSAGLSGGFTFAQGGLLTGQATVGWRRVTVENPLIPAFSGLAGAIDLGTTIGLGTRLGVRARRDVVFSADPLSPYYAQVMAGASLTQAIGERLEVGVRADRVWLDYVRAITEVAPPYKERVDVLGGVFTVKLPGGWRVSVNLETLRRGANSDPLRAYTTQRIYTAIAPTLKF